MALQKETRTGSGALMSYHRILRLEVETNYGVGIWVRSYLSASERNVERDDESTVVYHDDTYCFVEWNEAPMTVEDAYTWLKAERPEFAGATDC